MKTVEDMLKQMPRMQRDQRERAIRATCERIEEETSLKAAKEVKELLDSGADDREIITSLRTWVKVTEELNSE